jgi:hypothetical protein
MNRRREGAGLEGVDGLSMLILITLKDANTLLHSDLILDLTLR